MAKLHVRQKVNNKWTTTSLLVDVPKAPNELLEGVDYTVLFYGGKNNFAAEDLTRNPNNVYISFGEKRTDKNGDITIAINLFMNGSAEVINSEENLKALERAKKVVEQLSENSTPEEIKAAEASLKDAEKKVVEWSGFINLGSTWLGAVTKKANGTVQLSSNNLFKELGHAVVDTLVENVLDEQGNKYSPEAFINEKTGLLGDSPKQIVEYINYALGSQEGEGDTPLKVTFKIIGAQDLSIPAFEGGKAWWDASKPKEQRYSMSTQVVRIEKADRKPNISNRNIETTELDAQFTDELFN